MSIGVLIDYNLLWKYLIISLNLFVKKLVKLFQHFSRIYIKELAFSMESVHSILIVTS